MFGITKTTDINNFCRVKVMLYMPWRNEELDIDNQNISLLFDKWKDRIIEMEKSFVKDSDIDYESIKSELESEINHMEEELRQETDPEFRVHDLQRPENSLDYDIQSKIVPKPVEDRVFAFRNPTVLPDDEYQKLIRSLNQGQREYLIGKCSLHIEVILKFILIFTGIINSVKLGKMPLYHLITGSAGTGKSVLIRAIHQTLMKEFSKDHTMANPDQITVLLAAPTGLAAFNIGGSTIHGALGITTNENRSAQMKPLSDELRTKYAIRLENLKVMIIDEVSMVGNKMLAKIDQRLKEITGNISVYFGGVSILFFGDFNQLRPVKESYIFQMINTNDMSILAGTTLWDVFKLYRLTEIMRQKDDLLFAKALNNLTEFKLNAEDRALFEDRIFSENSNRVDRRLDKIPVNCIHLFTTNKDVDAHNNAMINRNKEKGFESKCFDSFSTGLSVNQREKVIEQISLLETTETQGLPSVVQLKTGIRYMITVNIDVCDGLVNGVSGILKKIDLTSNGFINLLRFDFEREDIGLIARQKFNEPDLTLTPIGRQTKSFFIKVERQLHSVLRSQFPLRPSEAITIHKSQGQTYDQVVIHLSSRMTITFYYTALSRAKSSNGLYLIGKFDPPVAPSPGNLVVIQEMDRMAAESPVIFDTQFVRPSNRITFFYQNYPYLHIHIEDLICDRNIREADILIMIETRTNGKLIEGFNLSHQIKYNSREHQSRPFGIAVYRKPHIISKFISEYVKINPQNTGHIEILAFETLNTRIISTYISPNFTNSLTDIFTSIYPYIEQTHPTVVIGDFNIDINSKTGTVLKQMFDEIGFKFRLVLNQNSTDKSQIDLLFANFDPVDALYYESIDTLHKPVFFFI